VRKAPKTPAYLEMVRRAEEVRCFLETLTLELAIEDGHEVRACVLAHRSKATIRLLVDELRELAGLSSRSRRNPTMTSVVEIVNEATGLDLGWAEVNEMLRAER